MTETTWNILLTLSNDWMETKENWGLWSNWLIQSRAQVTVILVNVKKSLETKWTSWNDSCLPTDRRKCRKGSCEFSQFVQLAKEKEESIATLKTCPMVRGKFPNECLRMSQVQCRLSQVQTTSKQFYKPLWQLRNRQQDTARKNSGRLFKWWRNAKPFSLSALTSHGLVRAHSMYKIVYMEKIWRFPEATSDLKLSSLRLTTVALPWPRLSTRLPVAFSTLARFRISIWAMSFRIWSSIRSRLPNSEMM